MTLVLLFAPTAVAVVRQGAVAFASTSALTADARPVAVASVALAGQSALALNGRTVVKGALSLSGESTLRLDRPVLSVVARPYTGTVVRPVRGDAP